MAVMQEPSDPGERRRLDRPPSARFAESPATDADAATERAPEPTLASRVARGSVIALAGAAFVAVLGGPLSVTAGLVAVAAVIGWLVGANVRSSGPAVVLAVASVAVGLVGVWLFAQSEGGVLGLVEYLADVHGPLALIDVAATALVAAGSAR
jgi:hypothetical protein